MGREGCGAGGRVEKITKSNWRYIKKSNSKLIARGESARGTARRRTSKSEVTAAVQWLETGRGQREV